MTSKLTKVSFYDGLYGITIHVIIGGEEVSDELLKKKIIKTPIPKDASAMTYALTNGNYIIHLKTFSWKIHEWGTLVHEIYHVVYETLESRGITDKNESYAYYLDYLLRSIVVRLNKKIKIGV